MQPKFKQKWELYIWLCLHTFIILSYVINLFYILFKYNTIIYEIDERFGASSPVGRAK